MVESEAPRARAPPPPASDDGGWASVAEEAAAHPHSHQGRPSTPQDASFVSSQPRHFPAAGPLPLDFESCFDGAGRLNRERLVLLLSDDGHLDGAP